MIRPCALLLTLVGVASLSLAGGSEKIDLQ